MPTYTCPRCGYTKQCKTHIRKHLRRKYICPYKFRNLTREECLFEILGEKFPDDNIKKTKNTEDKTDDKSAVKATMTVLETKKADEGAEEGADEKAAEERIEEKVDDEEEKQLLEEKEKIITEQSKEIEELKKKVEILNSSQPQIDNSTKIDTVNNFNIYLNAFGKEKMDYITSSIIKQITNIEPMNSVPKILKQIHFHPDHNENHNIYIPNKKQGFAKVYDGEKWVLTKKKDAIEDLTIKAFDVLSSSSTSENTQLSKIRDQYDNGDKKTTNRLHEDAELVILNNQNIVAKH